MPQKRRYFSTNDCRFFGYIYLILASVSIPAIVAAFFTADSNPCFETKRNIFAAILLVYPSLIFLIYFWQKRKITAREIEHARAELENLFNYEIENRLQALKEASEFFGASLKSADVSPLPESHRSGIHAKSV